jgi:hypothetical protein
MTNSPNEFGYCPRTPISNPVGTGPQTSPSVCGVQGSVSSSPARRKSRFFDTFRVKSPRNENVADENRSPKSLTKRKSVANIFASIRSRKVPTSDHAHDNDDIRRPNTASPSKQGAVLGMLTTPMLCISILTEHRRHVSLSNGPTKELWRCLGDYLW